MATESDFFPGTFGFRERRADVYENIEVNETEDGSIIHDKINGKTWNAGIFEVLNMNDIPKHDKRGGGKLHIIKGMGRDSPKYYLVDVLSSQGHPSNDGATYLAASNFNSLEFVSCRQTARNGISSYPHDHTQGPYCAIACGPSILYRNYFVQVPGSTERGQFDKEINLLEDTPIHVEHGYAIIKRADIQQLQQTDFDFTDLSKYKIASHKNCEVTMTRNNKNEFIFIQKEEGKRPQIAHHIYAAAFNMGRNVIQNEFTEKISESLLEAEYRNAILCAWDNSIKYPDRAGSKKLYLTLLGGGVFGNPMDLICNQIAKCKDLIIDSGLDVYVVCYDEYTFAEVFPLLQEVVETTGGSIVSTN